MVQHFQGLLLPVRFVQEPAEQEDLIGSSHRVRRPAGSLQISEVVPAHRLALGINKTGNAFQVPLGILAQGLREREAERIQGRVHDRVVSVLGQVEWSIGCTVGLLRHTPGGHGGQDEYRVNHGGRAFRGTRHFRERRHALECNIFRLFPVYRFTVQFPSWPAARERRPICFRHTPA